MKALTIHLALNSDGSLYCSCSLKISGVGEVSIKDLVSRETFDNLSKEVEENARIKMGMTYIKK